MLGESQVAAPLMARRAAHRALRLAYRRFQPGPGVGVQLARLWLSRKPQRPARGQFRHETLILAFALLAPAAVHPRQHGAVWRQRGRQVAPCGHTSTVRQRGNFMAPGWKADCGRSVTKICPTNVPHVGQGVVGWMRDDRNLTKRHLGRGTTRPGLGEADRGFVSGRGNGVPVCGIPSRWPWGPTTDISDGLADRLHRSAPTGRNPLLERRRCSQQPAWCPSRIRIVRTPLPQTAESLRIFGSPRVAAFPPWPGMASQICPAQMPVSRSRACRAPADCDHPVDTANPSP
jgi:hypothetical protein